jgi:hypothetical protein
VAKAIGRARACLAVAKLLSLVTTVKDADEQYFKILQPATIEAIVNIGGRDVAMAIREAMRGQAAGRTLIALQEAVKLLEAKAMSISATKTVPRSCTGSPPR